MEKEKDDGCIEYKLKLLNINNERIKHLATQMRYRCLEGNGECIYNIGVRDSGEMEGITQEEYEESVKIINIIAKKNNYSVLLLSKTAAFTDDKFIYEILIREINDNQ